MTNPYNQPGSGDPYGQQVPGWGQQNAAPPQPPKPKWTPFKTGLFGCLGLVVAGLSLFAGCAALGGLGAAVNDAGGSGDSTVATETTAPEVAEETTAPPELTADDIKLRVKTLDKQCFGSAGCNVTYRVEVVTVFVEVPADASYEVSYKVSGPESGPELGTFMITGDEYEVPPENYSGTSSSGVKLKAKVTEVVAQ